MYEGGIYDQIKFQTYQTNNEILTLKLSVISPTIQQMLRSQMDLNKVRVPPIRISIRQINRRPYARIIVQWKRRSQRMRRNAKRERIELAVRGTDLPCQHLVIVVTFGRGDQIEGAGPARTAAFVAVNVEVSEAFADELLPFVAGDVDFVPQWRTVG